MRIKSQTPDKLCRGCGKIKSRTEFHIDNAQASGIASRCKECKKKQNQKYYQAYTDKWAKEVEQKVVQEDVHEDNHIYCNHD